ncbi:Uncharacterised protein g9632 [Pycnogonum litorale]
MVLLRIFVALIVVTLIVTAETKSPSCLSSFITTVGEVYGADCFKCINTLRYDICAKLRVRKMKQICRSNHHSSSKCWMKKIIKLKSKRMLSKCFGGASKKCTRSGSLDG